MIILSLAFREGGLTLHKCVDKIKICKEMQRKIGILRLCQIEQKCSRCCQKKQEGEGEGEGRCQTLSQLET